MAEHPITPPPELVEQWASESLATQHLCTQAARWGADQQLEATYQWIRTNLKGMLRPANRIADDLRAAMRPKPPTLNNIALQMLGTIERDAHYMPEITNTIRRALEALSE